MIDFKHIATFHGPSIHSDEPVVIIELKFSDVVAKDAQERINRVTTASSNWFKFNPKHSPSTILTSGEFIAQWAHALLKQTTGKILTVHAHAIADTVQIILGHYHPQVSLHALRLATKVFIESDKIDGQNLQKVCAQFWQSSQAYHPDFQAEILMDYAKQQNIPVRPYMPGTRTWQYGWGAHAVTLFESSNLQDSAIGARWSSDKMLSKQLFARLGAPIAPSVIVTKEDELLKAASVIGFPCVTKPLDRSRSVGVTTNLRNQSDLIKGFRTARQQSQAAVMVEKHFEGEVHRIMIMQGKFWRVVRRNRPTVIGDGHSTILQLAEKLSEKFSKEKKHADFLGPAPVDAEFHQCLSEQGLSDTTVLAAGCKARIRNIPLLSKGANYEDVTTQTHQDVRRISEALAHNFGISNCGLDYVTDDITQSCFGHGVFLEINLTPGLRVPLMAGISVTEIGRAVLGEKPTAIPLTLIVAPRQSFDDLLAAIPKTHGTGWVSNQKYGIDSLVFLSPSPNIHAAFDLIVRHATVQRLFVICDSSEIAQQGLVTKYISKTFVLSNSTVDTSELALLKKYSQEYEQVANTAQLITKLNEPII